MNNERSSATKSQFMTPMAMAAADMWMMMVMAMLVKYFPLRQKTTTVTDSI